MFLHHPSKVVFFITLHDRIAAGEESIHLAEHAFDSLQHPRRSTSQMLEMELFI